MKCCENIKTQKEMESLVDFLKIISEENRLRILCLLQKGELCVCEIWQCLGLSQNLVSHHLKILKDAELIDSEKDKQKVIYFLNKKNLSKYKTVLNNIIK